jgi:hypothetical protein
MPGSTPVGDSLAGKPGNKKSLTSLGEMWQSPVCQHAVPCFTVLGQGVETG